MARFFIIAFSLLALVACQAEEENDKRISPKDIKNPNTLSGSADSLYPEMKFEEKHFDFGVLEEGEVVSHKFKFTNTGNANLIINNTSSSCGCTVSDYPRQPIAPGESGVINVEFDSNGRSNKVRKTVNITANTVPNIVKISIEAFVKTE